MALAAVICRVSELAADHGGLIAEMDINPLICSGTQIVAVDALIVLSSQLARERASSGGA